jgi:predicted metal-dependent HD superfamily phosphohydrolase
LASGRNQASLRGARPIGDPVPWVETHGYLHGIATRCEIVVVIVLTSIITLMLDDLKQRWLRLWSHLHAHGDASPVFELLVQRYSEPQRFYHNLQHIRACLDELETARALCAHPDEVEFALWFHDVVYDSKAKDSEERSADLAQTVAQQAKLSGEFSQRIRELILATKHNAVPSGANACVMVDCDLSILGRPAGEFDTYESAIRREYAWVAESDFRAGRRAVLEQFVNRPSIYSTELFRLKYESIAKENLRRSISRLT